MLNFFSLQCTHVTGVQELLDLAEQYLKAPVCTTSHLKHPFMVIEGLDGTGLYKV